MKNKFNKTGCRGVVVTLLLLLGLCAGQVEAQDLIINTRPLSPQEIKDFGLPGDTQTANGTQVVGLGQPVYLELLVEEGTVVTQVLWSIDSVIDEDGDPLVSSAVITNSPLGIDIPSFDLGDREDYDVAAQAVIYPDVQGSFQISVEALTSNATLNAEIEVVGSVFVGKGQYLCVICHAKKMPNFNATDHANAFKNQINGAGSDHFSPNCISCHVVGYDTTPGAVNGGFDDVATDTGWTFPSELSSTNWDAMPAELQNVSNIQCENCHGPAEEHIQTVFKTLEGTKKIGISLSAGNCAQCHDALTHHVKVEEWEQTLHATGYVLRDSGSCAPCHSTIGYIEENDPGMNELDEVVATRGTGNEGITCAACHDPHSPGAGVHQVRTIESVELENGTVIDTGGDGLVCMACHHDRRNAEQYVLTSARGPHHGTQTDMMFGENAIEYSQDMPSSRHWDVVEDTCAQCHMQDAESIDVPAYAEHKVGGHSFMLSYNDGTNAPVHITETCTSCHGEIEDFNFGGEDYDRDGMVEGVQKEIADMMYQLALLLPPYGVDDVDTGMISGSNPAQLSLRKGAYNYIFVEEDGSHGVHNPKYTAAILRASIDDLKGGIDIDCDGLLDEWEIANFGDLTSQSGSDDYDGDGLLNKEEYNVGTNPKLVDTDGDGLSDLVELQGGSDPLDINSILTKDLMIIPAAELAYLPKGTNTTVQFQYMKSLTDEAWSDLGPQQVSNGSNWVFQLESVRTNGMSRFYRAVEE